tara:strand:- start:35 stop:292 length:258 start_codon:yes stop_codon:yes gene_type:complete
MSINHKIKIINKKNKKDNFFCEVCSFPLINYLDYASEKDYNCCHDCYLKYAESRKKDWKQGWRPDNKTINHNNYIKRKLIISKGV